VIITLTARGISGPSSRKSECSGNFAEPSQQNLTLKACVVVQYTDAEMWQAILDCRKLSNSKSRRNRRQVSLTLARASHPSERSPAPPSAAHRTPYGKKALPSMNLMSFGPQAGLE